MDDGEHTRPPQQVPGRGGRRVDARGARKRADELLDQLAVAGRSREWVVRFALAREAEVDAGRTDTSADEEPRERPSKEELDTLTAGFMAIRDQEPLDDVADWANAVLALLADERR